MEGIVTDFGCHASTLDANHLAFQAMPPSIRQTLKRLEETCKGRPITMDATICSLGSGAPRNRRGCRKSHKPRCIRVRNFASNSICQSDSFWKTLSFAKQRGNGQLHSSVGKAAVTSLGPPLQAMPSKVTSLPSQCLFCATGSCLCLAHRQSRSAGPPALAAGHGCSLGFLFSTPSVTRHSLVLSGTDEVERHVVSVAGFWAWLTDSPEAEFTPVRAPAVLHEPPSMRRIPCKK